MIEKTTHFLSAFPRTNQELRRLYGGYQNRGLPVPSEFAFRLESLLEKEKNKTTAYKHLLKLQVSATSQSKNEIRSLNKKVNALNAIIKKQNQQLKEKAEAEAEVARLGELLFETRSLLTEFYDCVDIGGLHDGDCNISTEDPKKWDLGCNCTTAELRRKYIELYSK
jgi:hypothetical protein